MPPTRVLAACLGLVALVACSKTTTKAAPLPPPVLVVRAVAPIGGTSAGNCDGGCCVEIAEAPDATLVVSVDPNELALVSFVLRPPGVCGNYAQCGFLAVDIDPSDAGASRTVRSSVSDVPVPVAGLTGPHRIHVELRHQNDTPVLDAKGQPVHADVDVTLSPPGGCSTMAATDASDGASEDAQVDAGATADDAGDASPDAGDDAGDASPDAGDDAAPADAGPGDASAD
jgi:hypothetical protein